MKSSRCSGVLALTFLAFLGITSWAKNKPDADYQDGVLVSFKTITTGSSCSSSGHVNGTTDTNGNIAGTTNSTANCSDVTHRLYTVSVGENTFVLKPGLSKGSKAGAVASLGWSTLFAKDSVLSNQLPGTHIKVRSDADGFYVKVGNRESRYSVADAQ